ncbi:TonB-dependent receptor [Flavobacteriaceae bacterium TK19130]|nr:TonB-dependent receptor [Thermobacterium salinum]
MHKLYQKLANRSYFHFSLVTITFLFLGSGTLMAQEEGEEENDLGTEVVNIVKPYTPTISDAFKVKETPVLNDSVVTQKKEVEYQIFSVPVASTFTPAKGKAETVEKAKPVTVYDNYATLGFGSYTSILAELYSNFEISRTDNAGFYFRHNSSQGDIDGVLLENKFYDTQLDGHYTSRQRYTSYHLEGGIEHEIYNWYGYYNIDPTFIPDPDFINTIDPQQSYYGGYLGGSILVDDSFFEKVSAKLRYTGDAFSSSEFNITAQPEFRFPLTDFAISVKGDVDYLTGSFEKSYFSDQGIAYNTLLAGVTPALEYADEDLSLSIGATLVAGLDLENSASDFYIYPQIQASYRLVDELLIAYGGAEGGLEQNTYYQFKETNPFISPTQGIAPTSNLYEGFAGIKGKLSSSVGYNLRASYGKDENSPFFYSQVPAVGTNLDEGYRYGNSFGIVYDDMNTLSIFGELKVEPNENFSLGITGEFFSYDTESLDEAYNLPMLKASLYSNFEITEKLYGGASLFFVGERESIRFAISPESSIQPEERTLDAYLDANIHLGYRITERLNIFVKGSNLLNDNYEKWDNFPVQGIQGLLGATYKFDW